MTLLIRGRYARASFYAILALLMCVILNLESTSDLLRSQRKSSETTPVTPLPWRGLNMEMLKKDRTDGRSVSDILRKYPARESCPVAKEFLLELAGGVPVKQLPRKILRQLAENQQFWLATLYLMNNDTTTEGIEWAAFVWLEVVELPEHCSFESVLIDYGQGALLRWLFKGSPELPGAKFEHILAPLPSDKIELKDLDEFWDYFTTYGGDPRTDPLVRLDCFAASFDLNPSYRASWRKDPQISSIAEEFENWTGQERWSMTQSAAKKRKLDHARYAELRTKVLGGELEIKKDLFDN